MAQMTKELERIRDLVMKSPEANEILDSMVDESHQSFNKQSSIQIIDDQIIEISQYEDSPEDGHDNGYNSREISDLIHNRISIKRSLKNKQVCYFTNID